MSWYREFGFSGVEPGLERENFDLRSRIFLAAFGPIGFFLHWYLNQYIRHGDELVEKIELIAAAIHASYAFYLILGFTLLQFLVYVALIRHAEIKMYRIASRNVFQLGPKCLGYAVLPPLVTLVFGTINTFRELYSLGAVWDLGFLWVVVGVQYIGLWLYLHQGPSLAWWKSKDPTVELKQLEMVREEQRMLLRAFVAVTIAILISQVFGILKIKYDDLLEGGPEAIKQAPMAALNAIQLAFLLLGWWALVFSRCLRRMEEVRLRMKDIDTRRS